MARSYAILRPELTPEDIANYRHDKNHTLYTIPFGPNAGRILVRNAGEVGKWKNEHGENFIEAAKGHGALLAGNELARKISKAYKDVHGIEYVKTYDPVTGEFRIVPYPKKALAQKNWKTEHPELVELYNTHVAPAMKKGKPKKEVRYVVLTA